VVEVIGADPTVLSLLKSPQMNRDQWTSFLAVRVVRQGITQSRDTPPLVGSYQVDGELIRFRPRFPLEPGVRYRAELDAVGLHAVAQAISPVNGLAKGKPQSATRLAAEFYLPEHPLDPSAEITAVYPTKETLPENLLRLYIHFSTPMSRGESYRHIRLVDASDKPVHRPFLELGEELWSSDGKRFTLLLDPGRIKRGLKPREELGPILEAGKSYELVIDRAWCDAAGTPLRRGFRKAFRVGPPDETSPDPKSWGLRPPRAGTRGPLEVRFPEPMDRALLDRLIAVQDGAGRLVPGQVSVAGEETIWRWTPAGPWEPGDYRLVVGTDLEDLVGNSIARPFEVDLTGPITRRVTTETVAVHFRIASPTR
jgi:hypothetical protein